MNKGKITDYLHLPNETKTTKDIIHPNPLYPKPKFPGHSQFNHHDPKEQERGSLKYL